MESARSWEQQQIKEQPKIELDHKYVGWPGKQEYQHEQKQEQEQE